VEGPPKPPPLPSLILRSDVDIEVPGPLAGTGPEVSGERLAIRVESGTALVAPVAGAAVEVVTVEATASGDGWIEASSGKLRFRSDPGSILAQERCKHCKKGWKKEWRLRVAGSALAPPLVTDDRVCFGTLENRVYCVNPHNGHRQWLMNVGGRATNRLVAWAGHVESEAPTDPPTKPLDVQLILVVPDSSELVVLAATTGQKVASLPLSKTSDRLVGPPAVLPDGRIVVARQGYGPADATLKVYRLFIAPKPPPKDKDKDKSKVSEPGSAPAPP
jgi:outer membrane protein assembly factor BamB